MKASDYSYRHLNLNCWDNVLQNKSTECESYEPGTFGTVTHGISWLTTHVTMTILLVTG